ncbi:Protein kinase domain-containing protein 36 [Elsinoe fawcettii]|nr:Protein kinase domain-containing protein 36 [Elsinoe fawcettii]
MSADRRRPLRQRVDEAVWRPWSDIIHSDTQQRKVVPHGLGDRIVTRLSKLGLRRQHDSHRDISRRRTREIPTQSILKKGAIDYNGGHSGESGSQRRRRKGRLVQFDGSPGSASEELFHRDLEGSHPPAFDHRTVRKSLKRSRSAVPEVSTPSSFFHDFDIRRPFLRKKPHMQPIETHYTQPEHPANMVDNGGMSDSPESCYQSGNSVSPNSQVSTAPTSLFSSISPVQSQTSQGTKSSPDRTVTNGHITTPAAAQMMASSQRSSEAISQDQTAVNFIELPPSPEPDTSSIATAEKAAATKIYLETHFNKLLAAGPTERSLRRQSLQAYLVSLPVTDEQRLFATMEYYQAETAHTRQVRVLKTSSLIRHEMKGIGIAGYEVVRILGKGSFGVVRLVTEKSSSKIPIISPSLSTDLSHRRKKSLSRLSPNEVYAMKVIRKSSMLRNSQEAHLRAERDFLVASAASNSRWVVPLISSFQDNTNLYLVMEYMVGGDFLGLLLREDILDEPVARWYMAEMILCIEEAHKMRWIHRDIKPDNFLIDSHGHLKISDFGLAFDGWWGHDQSYFARLRYSLAEKLGVEIRGDDEDEEDALASTSTVSAPSSKDKRPTKPSDGSEAAKSNLLAHRDLSSRTQARSIVGTGQYMAPEIILGHAYDGRCDWWSLGIILYECLYGRTPFYRENRQATKECIVRHEETLWFPDGERWSRPGSEYRRWLMPVSPLGVELVGRLLCAKEQRLGSRGYEGEKRGLGNVFARRERRERYVVPEAVEEIKAHPWFEGVPWGEMHRLMPPFVPRVREGQSVTKYFEEEKSILLEESEESSEDEGGVGSMDGAEDKGGEGYWLRKARTQQEKRELGLMDKRDESFERLKKEVGPYWECWKRARVMEMEAKEMQHLPEQATDSREAAYMGVDARLMPAFDGPSSPAEAEPGQDEDTGAFLPAPSTKPSTASLRQPAQRKPKKRAKDKLLRDPALAKQVMEVRQKTAFLGYTFRRMNAPELWFDRGLVGVSYSGEQGWSGGFAEYNTARMDGQGWGEVLMDGACDPKPAKRKWWSAGGRPGTRTVKRCRN